jgi:two-component system, cell cycle sensor histidine kinase and response regulator CckA
MNNLPAEKNRRILIVDDNRAIHEDFRKILAPASNAAALDATEAALFGTPANTSQKIQYEIDSAYQGQEGVLLVEKALEAGRPYAMAFVDVRMPPGMDGVETTQKIWAVDPDIQIVLCTAYSDYSWDEMFEKIGDADGLVILKKPFDTVEALQLAHALTEKWWLQQQSRQKMEELERIVAERTRELQLAADALQQQKAELRLLFDMTPAMIWFKDTENNIVRINQRVADAVGKPVAEIEGKSVLEIYPYAQEAAKYYADDLEVIHSRKPKLGIVETLRGPDGKIIWIETDKVPVCDEGGKIVGIVVMAQDITERRSAEENVRRLAAIVENSDEAIIGETLDGIITNWNHAAEKMFGYPAAEIIGQPLQLIIPPEQENEETKILSGFARGEQVCRFETTRVRKDGQRFEVSATISPIKDANGKIVGASKIVRDITERKLAEKMLRESEERFSGAFEFAPIGMALVAPDGRWLKVNRALCHLVGYSEAELLARTFQDITHPDDLAPDLEYVRRLVAGEIRFYEMEKRYIHARGHFVTILLNVSLVRDGQGQPRYFISQIQDITERKQKEEELQRSQMLLRMAGRLVRVGAWAVSMPELNQIWSDEVCAIYEVPMGTVLPVEETINRYDPESREIIKHAFETCLRNGTAYDVEIQMTAASGKRVWLRAIGEAERNIAGVIYRIQGALQDISERKRAEMALHDAETKYRSVFENAIEGIYQSTPDGHYLAVNDALVRIYGYENPGEMINDVSDIQNQIYVNPAFREQFKQEIESAGFVRNLEYQVRRRDGSIIWISESARAVRSPDGTVHHYEGFIGEIDQRKRLEDQLFQSQKMETVGKLAGGIAHEFNSILTAIIGQSELLLNDLPAGSPLIHNATEITKAASRAAILTRQLLAYGRKQFLQPEILDLNQIIAGMESVFQHLMGGDVKVQMVPAAGLHSVKADTGQIEQVIMNLVINARDAMPNGGKLTLETANVSFNVDSVGLYPELKPGDYVMLAISDTGMGMSDAIKARAFEPFFSTKGVGQGTGLGLSTCYGIVKQSGGHISIYSEQGRGSTFKIYLPQVESETKISIPRLDSPDLPRGTETILLVEDDPALREMAGTLLRRLGYTVFTAGNGVEALSVQHEPGTGNIDLLFTDVVMPQMSGKELADRVRALYPRTKILFTSAYTETAIVHQGVLDQGVALLQKPFTPSALANKLREVLDQITSPAE